VGTGGKIPTVSISIKLVRLWVLMKQNAKNTFFADLQSTGTQYKSKPLD
jgi:hypothetical protein